MKSIWFWIIGVIVALWLFAGDQSHNDAASTTRNQFSPHRYQLETAHQQPSVPMYSSPVFKGYPCTVDCSGHEAGYEWAEENGINDPDDCGGNSVSFVEGCQVYAEEQQATMEEAIDSNDDDILVRRAQR